MKLKLVVDGFLAHLKEQGKSERTLYTYGKDCEQILAFFGAEREIDTIMVTQVGKFLKSDQLLTLPNGKPRAKATINKTKQVFRQLMTWAHDRELIKVTPIPTHY